MKKLFLMFSVVCTLSAFAGEVEVTSVAAQQRYPWNGQVGITVTIQGSAEDVSECVCVFAATNSATKTAIPIEHITHDGDDVTSNGVVTRKFIWDAKADVGAVKIDDVALSVDAFVGVQLWEGSPYWATCNVGAVSPEEAGYYFWWGDTVGYKRNANNSGWISVGGSSSFSFSSSNCPTCGKSNSQLQSDGYVDATGNLVVAHDAATTHLGSSWRMPTEAELSALINNCTTALTTYNDVAGCQVTGKGDYASKSIFFPAAGYGYGSSLLSNGSGGGGYGWLSTPNSDNFAESRTLRFDLTRFFLGSDYRWLGLSVRPVRSVGVSNNAMTTHLQLDTRTDTTVYTYDGFVPTTKTKLWSGFSATDIVSATGYFCSEWVDSPCDEVACNLKKDGTSVTVQFQHLEGTCVKCVGVKFFTESDGVYAQAIYSRYVNGAEKLGVDFDTCSYYSNTPGASEGWDRGYCVKNLRVTVATTGVIGLAHRWSFNGNLTDSVGGQTATAVGSVTTDGAQYTLAGGSRGSSYINLGSNILPNDGSGVTLEVWGTQKSVKKCGRIWDIGGNTSSDMLMAWTCQSDINADGICIRQIGGDQLAKLSPYTLGTEFHVATVFKPQADGTWKVYYYKQDASTGATLASATLDSKGTTWSLTTQNQTDCWLGHSHWSDNNDANASYNEVRVWKRALTEAELTANALLGPDMLPGDSPEPETPVYTVTFNANGGSCLTSSKQYSSGSTLGTLPTATRSGYVFDGWYTLPSGGDRVMSSTTVTGSMTLYAHWRPAAVMLVKMNSFRQRYPWNGLVDVDCEVSIGADSGYKVGLEVVDDEAGTNLAIKTLWVVGGEETNKYVSVRSGAQRLVWNADADLPDGFKCKMGRARLRLAKQVVFDAAGGQCDERAKTFVLGEPYGALPIPTRSGCRFVGWCAAAYDGARIDAESIADPAISVLTAKWEVR